MKLWRFVFALLIILPGSLQAWDSNVFNANLITMLTVAFAVLIPGIAAAISHNRTLLISAGITSLALLSLSRLLSPIPLPALLSISPLIVIVLLFRWQLYVNQRLPE